MQYIVFFDKRFLRQSINELKSITGESKISKYLSDSIIIVHGERSKSEYLKSELEKLPKKYEVTVPNIGDSFDV